MKPKSASDAATEIDMDFMKKKKKKELPTKHLCFRCKKECKEPLIIGEMRYCPNFYPQKFVDLFWMIKLFFAK